MQFNQGFVPGWNAIYSNLITKISHTIITSNIYDSPFSALVQSMETGNYVEDIHINPGHVMLQDTIINSDIFTDYVDDVAVGVYKTNVDLVFPSTYTEHIIRTSFSLIENVSLLINSLVANIKTTLEFTRTNLVKQMLFNYYQFGMISAITIPDPSLNANNSANMAVQLNTIIDDFRTEINPRNIIYNNRLQTIPPGQAGSSSQTDTARWTITNNIPYTILFNDYIRFAEFNNALNLGLIAKSEDPIRNMDWQRRMIRLNSADFPTSIPGTKRSAVNAANTSAEGINFFEMPKSIKPGGTAATNDFSNTPKGGSRILGFVLDPAAIKLYTQLQIHTAWLNPATLRNTNREIYRGIMEIGAFNKICAITCTPGT
jgi:hypothetical protein